MISLALVLQYSSEKRLNRLIVYIYIISVSNMSTMSTGSVLFTLRNSHGSDSPYRISSPKKAIIYNNMNYGPTFDVDLLLIGKNGTSSLGKTYDAPGYVRDMGPRNTYLAGSSEFVLSELEVYYSGISSSFLP